MVTSSYVLMKSTTFIVGFAFFGDPVIRRGVKYLNRRFPKWQKVIELQKYVFGFHSVILTLINNFSVLSSKASQQMHS